MIVENSDEKLDINQVHEILSRNLSLCRATAINSAQDNYINNIDTNEIMKTQMEMQKQLNNVEENSNMEEAVETNEHTRVSVE